MACVATSRPASSARRASVAISSADMRRTPDVDGSSAYGCVSAAPRLPSAPSPKSFRCVIRIRGESCQVRSDASSASARALGAGIMRLTRTASGSIASALCSRSRNRPKSSSSATTPGGASTPASSTSTTPREASASAARRNAATTSSSDSFGRRGVTSSLARSSRMPVGCPEPSRTIFPPAGSRVALETPPAPSAGRFSHPACPSVRARNTGRPREAASSVSDVGSACVPHAAWLQPAPVTQASAGSDSARLRTRLATSSSDVTFDTSRKSRPSSRSFSNQSPTLSRWM